VHYPSPYLSIVIYLTVENGHKSWLRLYRLQRGNLLNRQQLTHHKSQPVAAMLAGDRHVAVVTRDKIYLWDPKSILGCGLKRFDVPPDTYRRKRSGSSSTESTGETMLTFI
jgi:hypothetical protein